MKRMLPWSLLVLSLVGNVYLAILLLDAGIVLDNARSEVDVLWERRQVALKIINRCWAGRHVDELNELAGRLERQGVLVDPDRDGLEVGDFIFYVEGGLVTRVRDMSSTNDEAAGYELKNFSGEP